MLLDDPLEHGRLASSVPRAFGIDDGDGAALANTKAIGFRPKDAARLGKTQLLEALFQIIPRGKRAIAIAAFRFGLIGTQKNVSARVGNANRIGDLPKLCSAVYVIYAVC